MQVIVVPPRNPESVDPAVIFQAVANSRTPRDVLHWLGLEDDTDWHVAFLAQTSDGEYIFRRDSLDRQVDPAKTFYSRHGAYAYGDDILAAFPKEKRRGRVVLALFSGQSYYWDDRASRKFVIEEYVLGRLNDGEGVSLGHNPFLGDKPCCPI